MRLAVMVYSFANILSTGEATVPEVIRYLGDLGVDAVELTDAYVRDDNLDAIQAALAETGSEVVCYDVFGDFTAAAPADRQAALARVRRGFERARFFGTWQILLVPGPPPPGTSPDVARARVSEGIKQSLPEATPRGLAVSIENLGVQALVCGTSDHLKAIADIVGPDLGITFDAGNFLLASEDPLHALGQLSPRVVHVHLKDWQVVPSRVRPLPGEYPGLDGRSFRGAALGEGIVDLRAVLSRLRAVGYAGCAAVEYEGTNDPRDAVRRGVAYARPLLAE